MDRVPATQAMRARGGRPTCWRSLRIDQFWRLGLIRFEGLANQSNIDFALPVVGQSKSSRVVNPKRAPTLRPLFAAAMPPRLAKDGRPLPRPEKPKWAPRHLSLASAWKVFNCARAAWNAVARMAKISNKNPLSAWLRQIEPAWPKVAARERALEVDEPAGTQWVKQLVKMRDDANPTLTFCADYRFVHPALGWAQA